ncbi:MAG TPA: DUF4838 domain-containing protein, partial [Phnomibacter sp.]|nr:DUF4838 domain-containing protein [Phnomibacter sp.]
MLPNADSLEQVAAQELRKYFKTITGYHLPFTTKLHPINAGRPLIFLGKASPLQCTHEYNIKTLSGNLHIKGSTPIKTLEAVYIFLEQYGGCQFLLPDAETVPQKLNWVIQADYQHTPAITTRTVHSKLFFNNPLFAAKRRVSTVTFPGYVPWAGVHTFHKLVPAAQWLSTHPQFFALVNGKRQATQLCLSNDTVYNLVLDSVKAWFARSPQSTVLSVSQDDNTSYCTCERCKQVDNYEGSPAGTMVRFVSRIAKQFPDKTISTLAYQYTRKAPLHVKPAKNVLITLCSIECDRAAPITEACKDFEKDLMEWKQTGANLKIWDYTTQFTNFLAPFPNLHTLQPNLKLFARNNASWVFEQHSNNPSELFELRSYLLAQLLWNPDASFDSLYQLFTRHYYGPAAQYIEQYINHVHNAIKKQPNATLYLYGDPAQAFGTWLSLENLNRYNQWFDEAEQAVQQDSILLARAQNARMGIDYALLEYARRTQGVISLANTAFIQKTMDRFNSATQRMQATLINEMGLLTTTYIHRYQQLIAFARQPNLALHKKITILTKPRKYANENPQTLTDGVFGGWSFNANWLGWEANDMEFFLDLGQQTAFHKVGLHFL